MRFVQQQIVKGAAVSSLVASVMAAGNANAITEVAQLAAGDNRLGIIAFLFLPVVCSPKPLCCRHPRHWHPVLSNCMLDLVCPVSDVAWWAQVGWVLFNIGEPGEKAGCMLHNLACRSACVRAVVPLVWCFNNLSINSGKSCAAPCSAEPAGRHARRQG